MATNSGRAAQSRSQDAKNGAISVWERNETEALATVIADGFYTFAELDDNLAKVGDFITVYSPDYFALLEIKGKSIVGQITDPSTSRVVQTAWDTKLVFSGLATGTVAGVAPSDVAFVYDVTSADDFCVQINDAMQAAVLVGIHTLTVLPQQPTGIETYPVGCTIVVPDGFTLKAPKGRINLKVTAALDDLFDIGDNIVVDGFNLDMSSTTNFIVRAEWPVNPTFKNIYGIGWKYGTVYENGFNAGEAAVNPVWENFKLEQPSLDNPINGIWINGANGRQPSFGGSMKNVHIEGTPGTGFPADVNAGATADQIALMNHHDFIADGVTSIHGGENGVSVVRGSSNHTWTNLYTGFNDGHGAQFGGAISCIDVDDATLVTATPETTMNGGTIREGIAVTNIALGAQTFVDVSDGTLLTTGQFIRVIGDTSAARGELNKPLFKVGTITGNTFELLDSAGNPIDSTAYPAWVGPAGAVTRVMFAFSQPGTGAHGVLDRIVNGQVCVTFVTGEFLLGQIDTGINTVTVNDTGRVTNITLVNVRGEDNGQNVNNELDSNGDVRVLADVFVQQGDNVNVVSGEALSSGAIGVLFNSAYNSSVGKAYNGQFVNNGGIAPDFAYDSTTGVTLDHGAITAGLGVPDYTQDRWTGLVARRGPAGPLLRAAKWDEPGLSIVRANTDGDLLTFEGAKDDAVSVLGCISLLGLGDTGVVIDPSDPVDPTKPTFAAGCVISHMMVGPLKKTLTLADLANNAAVAAAPAPTIFTVENSNGDEVFIVKTDDDEFQELLRGDAFNSSATTIPATARVTRINSTAMSLITLRDADLQAMPDNTDVVVASISIQIPNSWDEKAVYSGVMRTVVSFTALPDNEVSVGYRTPGVLDVQTTGTSLATYDTYGHPAGALSQVVGEPHLIKGNALIDENSFATLSLNIVMRKKNYTPNPTNVLRIGATFHRGEVYRGGI